MASEKCSRHFPRARETNESRQSRCAAKWKPLPASDYTMITRLSSGLLQRYSLTDSLRGTDHRQSILFSAEKKLKTDIVIEKFM